MALIYAQDVRKLLVNNMTINKAKIKAVVSWIFKSFIWLAVLLLILDFVSKQIIRLNMRVGENIDLIPGFLSINYVINDGMAFGISFRSDAVNRVMFPIISVIGAAILIPIYVVNFKKLTGIAKASLMLMISGCLGNFIDRAFYSAEYLNASTHGVIDFIGFRFGTYDFPRFNVADSCLVIGTIMLAIYLLVLEIIEAKKKIVETPKTTEKFVSKDEKLLNGEDVDKEKE